MRVAIIANVRLYREGLAAALVREGVEVVGTAEDGHTGVVCVQAAWPDVALLDMAILDSIPIAQFLADSAPGVRVVALGVPETDGHVLTCVEAGVAGYLPQDGSLDDLLKTLNQVVCGELLCSPSIIGSLFRRVAELAGRSPSPVGRLTARELEILELIDQGFSNKQIARRLSITLSTVKNHVHNILEKLQVPRRTEAAAWARRRREREKPAPSGN